MKRFFKLLLLLPLLAFGATSCMNYLGQNTFNQNIVNAPYDAIIVPGFPFADSTWSDIMKMRVYWSQYLYEGGYAKNIIYSGSAVYTPYVESKIMKKYAEALGIPADHIFTENFANHSTENLYYSYQLARKKGFKKIAVATDPVQNAFLMRFAKKNKIEVEFLPIVFPTLEKIKKIDPEIDPSSAYVRNFVALPDRMSFFRRFKGTMGQHIDPTLYQ